MDYRAKGFPKLGVPNGATMVPNVTPIMENQMENLTFKGIRVLGI